MTVVRAADHQDWVPREKSLLLGLAAAWDVSVLGAWNASMFVAWVGQRGMEGELRWQLDRPGRLSCLALSLRSSLGAHSVEPGQFALSWQQSRGGSRLLWLRGAVGSGRRFFSSLTISRFLFLRTRGALLGA